MTSFVDQYLPSSVPGYPCVSAPRFSTTIQTSSGGGERRNQNWEHPLHRFSLPEAARHHEVFEDLKRHWMALRGPLNSFPWRDPLDFASMPLAQPNVAPTVTATDQVIGTGDGTAKTFQLSKAYTVGSSTYRRIITLPVVASVVCRIGGKALNDPTLSGQPYSFTVGRTTGVVTFDKAPPAGLSVTAGFLFDVPVRFETDDSLEGMIRTWQVSGFADLNLIEVRPC